MEKSPFEIKKELGNRQRENLKNILKRKIRDIFNYEKLKAKNFDQDSLKLIGLYLVLVDDLKTSQIRKILSMVNAIKFELQTIDENRLNASLHRIQTNLVYSSGRNRSLLNLATIFFEMIKEIIDEKNFDKKKEKFEKMYDVIQGIIAYHKIFGGQE